MYVCYSSQFCLLFCFHFVSFSLVCLTFYILDFPSDPLDFTNFFCCCWLRLVFNNLVASVVVNTRQQLWPPALCLGEMLWQKTCLRRYVCTYMSMYAYTGVYICQVVTLLPVYLCSLGWSLNERKWKFLNFDLANLLNLQVTVTHIKYGPSLK